MSVAFFSKEDVWSAKAEAYLKSVFGQGVETYKGVRGDSRPKAADLKDRYDIILSFLSPWILPTSILDKADVALNFHPGSCDYPGIGCYNFALYEEAKEYGPVCHHMLTKVDTGAVVREDLFSITPEMSVEQLKLKTMQVMYDMFVDVVDMLAAGKDLPVNDRTWQRRPFTRAELEELGVVRPDMEPKEIQKRVHVMTYPGFPGARVTLAGVDFLVPPPDREALA